MRIQSKLCHISESKVIVQVVGWLNDKNLGSAHAEGPTVEIAEDKAISRLNKRLEEYTNNDTAKKSIDIDESNIPLKVELPKSDKNHTINKIYEPSDWSNELTAIDSEIKRLNWTREDEMKLLEKTFGYNNRNKITSYADILKYLTLLKKTNVSHENMDGNYTIDTLIKESDNILRELKWDNAKGREYLQKEFNVSSRKDLNLEQLMLFVSKLKSIRNN